MAGIRQHLRSEALPERPSVWISIYVDKAALRGDIILHDLCTPDQWDGFCKGLSQASANLAVIDVAGKTMLDAKIKGTSRPASCKRSAIITSYRYARIRADICQPASDVAYLLWRYDPN